MAGGGAAIAGVGSIFSTVGKLREQKAAQNAEWKNSIALDEQARLVEKANARKLDLLKTEQERFSDRTKSMFAKNGISLEGSALEMVAADKAAMAFERNAVRQQQNYDVSRIRNAAQQASDSSNAYGQAQYWTIAEGMLSLGATGTSGAAQQNQNNQRSGVGATPTDSYKAKT